MVCKASLGHTSVGIAALGGSGSAILFLLLLLLLMFAGVGYLAMLQVDAWYCWAMWVGEAGRLRRMVSTSFRHCADGELAATADCDESWNPVNHVTLEGKC